MAGVRIECASVERRRGLGEVAGSPPQPANAWLAIALVASDPLFQAQVVDQVRPAMLPRIRARLDQDGLLRLAPRLRSRAALHQLTVFRVRVAELTEDPAMVRTGSSPAAAYGWPELHELPLDVYVPPPLVAELLASPEPGQARQARASGCAWWRAPGGGAGRCSGCARRAYRRWLGLPRGARAVRPARPAPRRPLSPGHR
ncbi:MAG: hypothetical protein JOZ87_39965 [Chloroflexi bacterium]|nr:hypothetical protein [Chloroflexota bacterium]